MALGAERELEIVRAIDGIADDAGSIDELLSRSSAWLTEALGAPSVVAAVTDVGLQVPPGATAPLTAALAELGVPPMGWQPCRLGEVELLALRPREELVGVIAVQKDSLGDDDAGVLRAFCERADSALEHALERAALLDRTRELEAIYAIDHIRDAGLPFREMLQAILGKVLELIRVDAALIALVELHAPEGDMQVHARAASGERQTTGRFLTEQRSFVYAMVEQAFAARDLVVAPLPGEDREVVCMPLILDDEVLGAFMLLGDEGRPVPERDRRVFAAVCSQADTAIFEDVARQRIKNVFKRYVSKDVVAELLRRDEDFLRGRRAEVSCFFSDLRGFTSVSEQLDVDVVVGMLNEHLDAMTAVVFEHGGTVDKFIGDCVMAFFGAPLHQPDHALRAVRCADAMRARHNEIAAGWEARGLPPVKIGIGLHSGEVFVGTIGGQALASYTIIGDHVNLAARLEGESGPDDIILSEAAVELVREHVEVEERGEVVVKGKTVACRIFNLVGVRG